MIFVTVGTQTSFDRFIKMLDEIAPELDEEIVAQTKGGTYQTKFIQTIDFLAQDVMDDYFNKARLIVAHAGMGTIISALTLNKPIVVMPRLASLGEHRNDHQIATAMRLNELGYIYAAYDKRQLKELLLNKELKPLRKIGCKASEMFIKSISEFIKEK